MVINLVFHLALHYGVVVVRGEEVVRRAVKERRFARLVLRLQLICVRMDVLRATKERETLLWAKREGSVSDKGGRGQRMAHSGEKARVSVMAIGGSKWGNRSEGREATHTAHSEECIRWKAGTIESRPPPMVGCLYSRARAGSSVGRIIGFDSSSHAESKKLTVTAAPLKRTSLSQFRT